MDRKLRFAPKGWGGCQSGSKVGPRTGVKLGHLVCAIPCIGTRPLHIATFAKAHWPQASSDQFVVLDLRLSGSWKLLPFKNVNMMRKAVEDGPCANPVVCTSGRKLSRGLIGWYEEVMERVAAQNADVCAAFLRAQMEVRGFGPVRKAAIKKEEASASRALETL